MKKIFALVFILSVFLSPTVFAESFTSLQASSWTKQESYGDKTVHKLGFGLLNITMGWTAIPFQIDQHKGTNPYTGLFKGIWLTATNTVGGVLHAATFPIPLDIPLPDGGVRFE
ncbi:MAG TPA: hypothetical protein DIS66_01290 [Candidatus Omnitrophica bacterium]|nr:hypothetical protein [Candidatus Omnitrophota bacterium]